MGFAAIALAVIVFGLGSKRLESSPLTGPLLFTGFGLLIGPYGTGLADVHFSHGFVHTLAEVTLALVLFSDAARIELSVVKRDHDLPVRMLVIGMPLIIVLGTALALALPLGLGLWEAALLAAILAPTDAALGQSVVSSPLVPARIRQALNVESGLNDGIVLPLVVLFACLASEGATDDRNWLVFGLMQVTLGPLVGLVIGAILARLIDRAVESGWMEPSYEGPAVLGAALLAFAVAELVGGNGFIATFVAGLVFGNTLRNRCGFLFEFAEAQGQLLIMLTFLVFGAAILPSVLGHAGGWAIVYAVLSLTVIRLVPIAIALLGSRVRPMTVVFLGWFGPRGLASILFALFVIEGAALPGAETLLTVVVLTVALSVILHGLSAAPLARAYGSHMRGIPKCAEVKPVAEIPTRTGAVIDAPVQP